MTKKYRTSVWSNVVLLVALSPVLILGTLAFFRHGSVVGAALALAGSAIFLYASTISVLITKDEVGFFQFFSMKWKADISSLDVVDSTGSDKTLIPSLIFVDKVDGRVVGSIRKTQFLAATIGDIKRHFYSQPMTRAKHRY